MPENATLRSEQPLYLTVGYGTDPDHGEYLAVYLPVVGEELPRLIARQQATEATAQFLAPLLTAEPRYLVYQGQEAEPGIFAMLFAELPGNLLHQEGEEWKKGEADDTTATLYLGTLVRYRHDMPAGLPFSEQCTRHFKAVLAGKTMEPVDKAIEAMDRL